MFKKLNKNITISEYTKKEDVVSYGNAISYSNVTVPLTNVYSLVPERYRNKFVLLIMEICGYIPPHTDSKILTTINVYIDPGNCVTTFYDFKPDSTIESFRVKNQTNGCIFRKDQLNATDSFVANKDEVWLLDVTKPHGVEPLNQESSIKRVALALQTNYFTFDEVQEMLKETGYI